jgi:hypothetical protein
MKRLGKGDSSFIDDLIEDGQIVEDLPEEPSQEHTQPKRKVLKQEIAETVKPERVRN